MLLCGCSKAPTAKPMPSATSAETNAPAWTDAIRLGHFPYDGAPRIGFVDESNRVYYLYVEAATNLYPEAEVGKVYKLKGTTIVEHISVQRTIIETDDCGMLEVELPDMTLIDDRHMQ